jgi:hypothetical protein
VQFGDAAEGSTPTKIRNPCENLVALKADQNLCFDNSTSAASSLSLIAKKRVGFYLIEFQYHGE